MKQIKICSDCDPSRFTRDLNNKLDELGDKVIEIQYSTCETGDSANIYINFSAIIIYKD